MYNVCLQQQYESFKINVVMIIGDIPKHTVAPYTVAGTFLGPQRFLSLFSFSDVKSDYLYNGIHKCFEVKLRMQ